VQLSATFGNANVSAFLPFDDYQIVLAATVAAVWGLGCSVFERVILAPRRRLSAMGAAYAPAMTLALIAGAVFVTTEGQSIGIALLMAGFFFLIGSLPALGSFHLMRRVLRTHFQHD
jgi:hypothetical protein